MFASFQYLANCLVMEDRVHLRLDQSAASAIDAYWEYRNIVGEDDHGKLFTPEEYEAYKKEVLPNRLKNRLYVSWSNPSGMDCKLIGPETPCFCTHRYKQHKTDFDGPVSNNSELRCKVRNCQCSGFYFIPKNGNQALRCHCKHTANEHFEKAPYMCKIKSCKCTQFETSFRCGCGSLVSAHSMLIETRDERLKRGHPVAREEVPYAAMGGLTGLSSLIDGYMRLDDSGIGAPSREFLEQPSTSQSRVEPSHRLSHSSSHGTPQQSRSNDASANKRYARSPKK